MTQPLPATTSQRAGEAISLVEAAGFVLAAVLHAGISIGGVSEPAVPPAALLEGVVAFGLLIAIVLPGRGGRRAGRVLAMQVLALIVLFVGQVTMAFGRMPDSWSGAGLRVALFVMALGSVLLLGARRVPRAI